MSTRVSYELLASRALHANVPNALSCLVSNKDHMGHASQGWCAW